MASSHESERISPAASAYIDAALKAWDKKKSKLATKYLGRNIRKELNRPGRVNPMHSNVAILGTLTEQPDFVKNIFAATLEDLQGLETMSAWGAEIHPAFGWCAQQLNLTGYQKIFDHTYYDARFGTPKASKEINRTISDGDPTGLLPGKNFYLGTVEEASDFFKMESISMLDSLLREMMHVALHRRYPIANDWGWTEEQYDEDLDIDAQFIRARLGLPPKMPAFPEDPTVVLPAGFTHLPPVKTWKNEIFGNPV